MVCFVAWIVVVVITALRVTTVESGPIRPPANSVDERNTNFPYNGNFTAISKLTFINSRTFEHFHFGDEEVTLYETNRPCRDETNSYLPGDVYVRADNPCLKCICSDNGEICTPIQCPLLPDSCIEVHRAPHQCCVTCVKEGCSFKNQTYHVGESIQISPCRTCKCETDGIAYCTVADCGPPECVDPVQNEFECCPSCPRGANCIAEGIIIPADHIVVIPRICRMCRCLYNRGERYWQGSKLAKCTYFEECRMGERHRNRLRRSSYRYFNEYIHIAD